MRPFTVRTDVVAGDKASRVYTKISDAANRMAKSIERDSRMAGSAFSRISESINRTAKRSIVGLNNLNARVNQTVRNIGKKLGSLGKLGLGLSFLAIASTIIDANVQVDDSFANLSAITGKSGSEFEAYKGQVASVSKEQRLFAADVAKGFEIVASAKPELLANADALARVTNAAITLSKASGDDLAQSSLNLAGVMNQFTLEASQAERVMNALAAGSVAGSANITNVAASMKNFGAVAAGANITMEQSVALVEVLGAKSIFAEEAGTKLKGSILKLQQAGVGYASGQFKINDALTEARSKYDKLSTAQKRDAFLLKTFGAENITTGQILLENIGMFNDMTTSVTGTNTAVEQMNTKANTFSNRWSEVQNAFKNSITATKEQGGQMQSLKDIMAFVAENMDKIIAGIIIALKVFAAYKVIMTAVNIVTWAFNTALWANPITWIVAGVIALIAVIAALIIYWKDLVNWVKESDNWFAKIIRFALYPIIALFKTIGMIINWVSEKFSQFINWIKTSDSAFAGFLRTGIFLLSEFVGVLGKVWDGIVWLIETAIQPMIDAFEKLGEVIDFFSGQTQKELGVDVNKKLTLEQRGINPNDLTPEQMGISSKVDVEMQKNKANDELIKSLTVNSGALDENTKSKKKEWTGRFSTTILRDMNLSEPTVKSSSGIAQKELAIAAMGNEINNSNMQSEIINNSTAPTSVITRTSNTVRKKDNNTQGNVKIEIVDKTSNKFSVNVEGTGVEVTKTGN